jgi:hypothetical protein
MRPSFDPVCALSSMAEMAKSRAAQIRGSIVVSISACHAEDPGSIPGRGVCRGAAVVGVQCVAFEGGSNGRSAVVRTPAWHAVDARSIPGVCLAGAALLFMASPASCCLEPACIKRYSSQGLFDGSGSTIQQLLQSCRFQEIERCVKKTRMAAGVHG